MITSSTSSTAPNDTDLPERKALHRAQVGWFFNDWANGAFSATVLTVLLIAQGASNHQVAEALAVSERTARTHVSDILDRLGLVSRTQAALWAIREGIVPSPRQPS